MSGHLIKHAQLEGFPVVTLVSVDAELEASFAPTAGMVGCSLLHRGEELLGTRDGLASYALKRNTMGIPFLHPWANRLADFSYEVEGRVYDIDPRSPAIRLDANGLPMHGLLAASPYWSEPKVAADDDYAELTTTFDFAAQAELMEVFPFAHEIEMTIRLRRSTLTIETAVHATGIDVVPISFGFHPYFKLPGVPASEWRVQMPAGRHIEVDEKMIPTGETTAVSVPTEPLGDRAYDDGFDELASPARFSISGGGRAIDVEFEHGYPVAVVWHPEGGDFICFEPMTAHTNALGSAGHELQLVQPGESYSASWSVTVS
jgi:galactose mutarotase-like enzyme